MISLTIPNVITIGIISLLVTALAKWGARAAGLNLSFL